MACKDYLCYTETGLKKGQKGGNRNVKETKEIRMEKGKPYPLGWTESADGSVNLAAVLERNKECGVILYPRRGGAPRRLAFREEDRIGKICCM